MKQAKTSAIEASVPLESSLSPLPRFAGSTYVAAGRLRGAVALITGGDSGIGRAVTILYAREGAKVVIIYLPEDEADARTTAAVVEAERGTCMLLPGDVTRSAFCTEAANHVVSELGRLDILVNNAAIETACARLTDITDEQFDRTMRTNLYGCFFMTRAALSHLRSGGAIINTGSPAATRGSMTAVDYAASKGGVHALTKSLAHQLRPTGIRVNCVVPGPVWTPLNPSEWDAEQLRRHDAEPLRRPAHPEEVAPIYVFLASPSDAAGITGAIVTLTDVTG